MASIIMEPLQDSKISSNNVEESMEIDEYTRMSASSIEDGEISESDVVIARNKIYENRDGEFTTGVDIFSQETQGKLTERAKRFGLDPKNVCAMSDEQLRMLHESLGLNEQEMRHIRLDTIHVRGTENMSTEDVFEYFKAYGPANIEWISDYSCNVVWNDDSSTARALNGLSKSIKGLKRNKDCDNTAEDGAELETTVIVSKLQDGDGDVVMVEEEFVHEANVDNVDSIQASSIKIPIPPGYWRYGLPHPKAKCILLRFATKSDKKPMRAEKMSTYYKKYGNPNFGGMKGLISDSRRKSKHLQVSSKESEMQDEDVKKNPWGTLSKQWNDEPQEVLVRNPTTARSTNTNRPILDRIGNRRDTKKRSVKSSGGESDSSDEWKKRIKKPRMKMYADEEQQRINKNRLQKVIQHKYNNIHSQAKMHELRDVEHKSLVTKSNIKSRLGKIIHKEEPKRTEGKRNIKERLSQRRYSYDSDNYIESIHTAQPYASVVQKVRRASPIRSAITSTITRYEIERRRNNTSESSYESSDNETGEKKDLRQSVRTKSVVHRPGFDEDLRSRLTHNSIATGSKALRIEVNNEYYSDNS